MVDENFQVNLFVVVVIIFKRTMLLIGLRDMRQKRSRVRCGDVRIVNVGILGSASDGLKLTVKLHRLNRDFKPFSMLIYRTKEK